MQITLEKCHSSFYSKQCGTNLIVCISVIIYFIPLNIKAQIPVEVFSGQERTTLDIMFFKFFKNNEGENTRWLFFNRNRASIDYRITKTTYLPQFGFTEAVSYNHEKMLGFAPVIVAQVLSWGVFSKTGLQYARISKKATLFSWLVVQTKQQPDIDYFLLYRYTSKLTESFKLFTQFESVNAIPTQGGKNFNFTQRIRLGLQSKTYQFGMGVDFNQSGNDTFINSKNIGGFIRHEF